MKQTNHIVSGFFCLWCVTFLVPCALADTVHVKDDSFINSAKPNERNGTGKEIVVSNTRNQGARQGFVKFDLATLPIDVDISHARLRLWVNKILGQGKLVLHEVLADWSEELLTANTAPPLGPVFNGVIMSQGDEESFLTIDVTAVVQSWLEKPIGNFGFAILPSGGGAFQVEMDSKESTGTSHPMELEVVLEGVPGPKGEQGDPGPSGPPGPPGPPGTSVLGVRCQDLQAYMTGINETGEAECKSFFADDDRDGFTILSGDCNDKFQEGEQINPDANYMTTVRPDGGGYDWNCDSREEPGPLVIQPCFLNSDLTCSETGEALLDSSTPSCGEIVQVGTYGCVLNVSPPSLTCNSDLSDLRSTRNVVQECR